MADQKIKKGVRIPAGELASVKNWHLPQVNSTHIVRSPFEEKKRTKPAVSVTQEEINVEPLTVAAIEKLRQQSEEEGYRKGHSEGLETGLSEGRAKGEELGYTTGMKRAEGEINALKATLNGLMGAISSPLEQQRDELEETLLTLIQDATKAVIGAELSTRPELLTSAIEKALKTLPHESEDLTFTINPDDLALVESLRDQESANWAIKTDASVQQGGLVVKGVNSYVDYSIEGRYADVMSQLLNQNNEDDDSDGDSAGHQT